jgi:hypothetical protein
MQHKGVHDHPWPKAKKPDPRSKEEFKKLVANNPKAGVFKLKVKFFHPDSSHPFADVAISLTLCPPTGWSSLR